MNKVALAIILTDFFAISLVTPAMIDAQIEVETKASILDKDKKYEGYSVYLLRDSENKNEVSYVGITNDPKRRAQEHARDNRKKQMENRGRCM